MFFTMFFLAFPGDSIIFSFRWSSKLHGSSNCSCVTSKVSIKALLHAPRGNGRTKDQRQLWENRHGTLEKQNTTRKRREKREVCMKIVGLNLPSREWIQSPPNGKRKIIFKMSFWGDMLVLWRVTNLFWIWQIIMNISDYNDYGHYRSRSMYEYKKSRKNQSKQFQLNVITIWSYSYN